MENFDLKWFIKGYLNACRCFEKYPEDIEYWRRSLKTWKKLIDAELKRSI